MAVKYLIKSIIKATEINENFEDTTMITYSGKGGKICGWYEICGESTKNHITLIPEYDAKELGYTRLSDAKKNYAYTHHRDTDFWVVVSVEIVAFEI